MKNFNKSIVAILLMAATLTSCGDSKKIPAEIPESSSEAEISAEQSSEAEDTTVEETTEAPTSAETTTVATTIPIEDRKPKVNKFTSSHVNKGVTFEYNYCFVPEEATVISDDINLGLITVDGKEFDITALSNAYGEEEIQSIFSEQAGLYTTEKLIKDGIFDDVYIAKKGSPVNDVFVFGNDFEYGADVEVIQEVLGFPKSKGAYDFINVEYVNNWFKGLYSKCFAKNVPPSTEQITVNGEEKAFVEIKMGNTKPQYTANEDNLVNYTDKNIAVGSSTTYSDLVSMFGAEPTYINDTDYALGNIYTYRNSTVTVGFVINDFQSDKDWTEEKRNNATVVAVYQWLND